MGKENDLLEAARSGNIVLVEKLLAPKSKGKWSSSLQFPLVQTFLKGPNVNCQDPNGDTPLHFAALNNHKEIVEFLLKHQASANIPDQKGCYPLHLAAWRGNFEICQVLLTKGPSKSSINVQNLDGDTALHSAAQSGHTDVVSVLLQNYASPLIKNSKGEKALDLAVMYGRQETVEKLLNSPDSKIYLNLTKQDKSPLHLAAKSGNLNVVKMLLSAGFDVNHLTDSGTALHEASLHGKLEVFKLLLAQGGDVMLTDVDRKTTVDLLNDLNNPASFDMKKLVRDFDNERIKTAQKNIDNSLLFSIYEDYDTIRRAAGKHQGMDSVSHISRNSIGSSSSSVFNAGGLAEEENIYDCPQAGARSLYPVAGGTKPLLVPSSSFNKNEKPNTPKKPPRKKIVNSTSRPVEKQGGSDPGPDSAGGTRGSGSQTEGSSQNFATPVGSYSSDKTQSGSFHQHSSSLLRKTSSSASGGIHDSDVPENVPSDGSSNVVPPRRILCNSVSSDPTSGDRNSAPLDYQPMQASCTRPGNLLVGIQGDKALNEPPTPDHPPPSPETALLGIQQLINLERRKSRDTQTSTEFEDAGTDDCRAASQAGVSIFRNKNFPPESNLELNNNISIFHGLTLGSSPMCTLSPSKKSLRAQRFNSLMNLKAAPTTVHQQSPTTLAEENIAMEVNKSDSNDSTLRSSATCRPSRIEEVEETKSPEKTREDWTQIEKLLKSSLPRGIEMLKNECDRKMASILSDRGTQSMLSVTDWLEGFGMSQYEDNLIVNGFDDMQFMNLLQTSDMNEVGITNGDHRLLLSDRCRALPRPPESSFESVRSWLESLRLIEYHEVFHLHGYFTVDRILESSESQLQEVFKHMLPGHQKRLKHSLQDRLSKHPRMSKVDAGSSENISECVTQEDDDICPHRPESLITGCCNYAVQYLGSREVSILDGCDPPKFAIAKMKDSLTCVDKLPTVTLSISYLGVRFIDLKNKTVICSHDISNIFSASQGEDCLDYFAYITQSVDDGPFLSHVFHAKSEGLAREIMMTLGEAFYVAYQLAVRDQNSSAEGTNKSRDSFSPTAASANQASTSIAAVASRNETRSYQGRSTEI